MLGTNRVNGGRYLSQEDYDAMRDEKRQARKVRKAKHIRRLVFSLAVFLAGDALLLYMILNDLIDIRFGLAALIVLSYACGWEGRKP